MNQRASFQDGLDVMLDLETMGTAPGCAVLSIGAVVFTDRGLGLKFHQIIRIDDSVKMGLQVDSTTMAWWSSQSYEAQETLRFAQLTDDEVHVSGVKDAAELFNEWLVDNATPKARVWGNGANFDQPILRAMYAAVGVRPAWSPFNERCYRTLKSLVVGPPLVRSGTRHNALDDAVSQAERAVVLLRQLRQPPAPPTAPQQEKLVVTRASDVI